MAKLAIYGAGGFGRELLVAARGRGSEIVFIDDERRGQSELGIPILGLGELNPEDHEVVFAAGSGQVRRRMAERCLEYGLSLGRLTAPTAIVGHDVEIGPGAVLCDMTMITSSARIGGHFQCNIYSYVAHDCEVGDYVTFAPKVCCNGNVHIEADVYVGTGVIIRQGTRENPIVIGRGAVLGMGAVIIRDVPAGAVMIGNPARPR